VPLGNDHLGNEYKFQATTNSTDRFVLNEILQWVSKAMHGMRDTQWKVPSEEAKWVVEMPRLERGTQRLCATAGLLLNLSRVAAWAAACRSAMTSCCCVSAAAAAPLAAATHTT